jgi:hypothetical protein
MLPTSQEHKAWPKIFLRTKRSSFFSQNSNEDGEKFHVYFFTIIDDASK